MKQKKRPIVYTFIDSQNLNLGTGKNLYKKNKLIYEGWRLDFKKFYLYLKNKFKVSKTFLFIGYIQQNQKLYNFLSSCGYTLVFKPTTKDSQGKFKGNVDGELIFHAAAIEFTNYKKAIVVAGDGDYHCLLEYLESKNKLYKLIIPNRYSESRLLNKFQSYKIFLYREKNNLVYTNKNGRRHA